MKLRMRKCGQTMASPMFPAARNLTAHAVAACMLAVCTLLFAAALPAHAASDQQNAAVRPCRTWFIDETGFHASAHANMSCADCHAEQADHEHPRADKLNKPASTAFNRETCLQCHGDVEDNLTKGMHGGKPVMKTQDYNNCVTCHNPHYVLAPEARAKGLRPVGDMSQSCGVCHKAQTDLPKPAPDVAACLSCHGLKTGKGMLPVGGAAGVTASAAKPQGGSTATPVAFNKGKEAQGPVMCLSCHGPESGAVAPAGAMPRITAEGMKSMTHGDMNCLTCHKDAARYPHNRQERVNCLTCHTRHDEKKIHDAHSNVSCGACHLSGVTPVLKDGKVDYVINSGPLSVHSMTLASGTASCVRCHSAGPAATGATTSAGGASGGFAGNGVVGAANTILPPKSVLCMGCHAATFSVQDTPGQIGLGIFVLVFAGMGLFWFSCANLGKGSPQKPQAADAATGQSHGCPAPHQHANGENRWAALCCDVFLQRRLYRESPLRWAVHALIFFPFLFRFVWGLLGLTGSLLSPAQEWPWLLLDKNWGAGAFLFDLSGLALLLGLLLAAVLWRREKSAAANAPRHDWPALYLLLGITLTGFVLEGMRIALTGMPDGSSYAFAGHVLALGLAPLGQATLARVYGWGWYVHAVLTALTVAYIPFSQLRHMFTAPLFLLVQTIRGRH